MKIGNVLLGAGLAALLATAAIAQQSGQPGHQMDQGMMGHGMMGQMMGQGTPGMGMPGMMGQGNSGNAMSGMMANMSQMMAHMSEMMKGMEAGGMAAQAMNMGQPKGDQGPVSQAFAKANADMHEGMDIEFSGNADVDFVKGMIPHHQGAVAMAKILLENGKDPELRKLAENIVAAQETEIAFMQEWLAKNGK